MTKPTFIKYIWSHFPLRCLQKPQNSIAAKIRKVQKLKKVYINFQFFSYKKQNRFKKKTKSVRYRTRHKGMSLDVSVLCYNMRKSLHYTEEALIQAWLQAEATFVSFPSGKLAKKKKKKKKKLVQKHLLENCEPAITIELLGDQFSFNWSS